MKAILLSINPQTLQLLKLYSEENTEMGGMIFEKENEIVAISCKRGQKYSISFSKEEPSLFIGPNNTKIVGTWHSHLGPNKPSCTDKRQWRKWGSKYFHIILNTHSIKIYNFRAVLVNEIKMEV